MHNELEIKIKRIGEKYKATCQLFPGCKGIGETEDEALKKLTQSIGRFLGKVTSKMMTEVIDNEDYTEIIETEDKDVVSDMETLIDMKVEDKEFTNTDASSTVKRIYSMGNMLGFNDFEKSEEVSEKNNMFKLIKKGEHSPIMLTQKDILETAKVNDFDSVLGDLFNQDGYVFGFPINFN